VRFAALSGPIRRATKFARCGRFGNHLRIAKDAQKQDSVPVILPLQRLLDQIRLNGGNPATGPIFGTMKGTPLSVNDVLDRQILPALNVGCGKGSDEHGKETHEYARDSARPAWHGWHAFSRGPATNLHDLGVPDKTIPAIPRHANVPSDAERLHQESRQPKHCGDASA